MDTHVEAKRSSRVQSVDRAIAVLNELSRQSRPRTAFEVAEATSLHRTIVHRLLRTLVSSGMVKDEGGGRYGPGPRLLTLGFEYLDNLAVRRIALPYLIELSTEAVQDRPWVVAMGVPVSDQVVVVERIWHPAAPLSSILDIGVRLPMNHSAAGRAVLAALSDDQAIDLVGAASFREMGSRLMSVRQTGISFSNNEIQPGIGAAAAAVLDVAGQPVATVIVAGARLDDELNPDSALSMQIRRTAATVSNTLAKATT